MHASSHSPGAVPCSDPTHIMMDGDADCESQSDAPISTGFYDPRESDLPEEGDVRAIDAGTRPDFSINSLHPTLDVGCFTLPPLLTKAIEALAHELARRGPPEEGEAIPWEHECEQGALLFLRRVLLEQRSALGTPLWEWPLGEAPPRVCRRYGEAHAAFAHTDLRLAERPMYNLWIPLEDQVRSEPLLLFAAADEVAEHVDWRRAKPTAHHLPRACADMGEWLHWPRLARGQALIFPGDGGGHLRGGLGIFHGSAWATEGTRQSFDVRELLVPPPPPPPPQLPSCVAHNGGGAEVGGGSGGGGAGCGGGELAADAADAAAAAVEAARARLEAEVAAWEAHVARKLEL